MASLSRFKSNVAKINEGSWVALGEEFGDIEIETKGFTDAYIDARQAKMRRAAQRYNGDVQKIPQTEVRSLVAALMIQHCLLGVRNLQDEKGNEISFETFKELLYEEQYLDLYTAVLQAATIVTNEREADLEVAKKNSPTPSA